MKHCPAPSKKWLILVDAMIAVLLFLFISHAARQHLSSLNNGRSTVSSIEMLYGPAVMLASGRGFYQPDLDASPALGEFLRNERDALSPEDLPPDLPEEPNSVSSYHRYLLYTVAFFWRLYGISWTSLEPLCAILLGCCGIAVFAIMRLGMGRLLAAALTVFFTLSPQMFTMLPSLRDFSKAPFLLMLIFLLGLLIKVRFQFRPLLLLALVLGLINGIAMGFRQDALVFVAPGLVILTAAVIREGRPFQWRRVLVPVVFLVSFWAAGHPMLGRMEGGAQPYHPVVQGFSMKRAASLGLEPGAYEALASGGDNYAFSMLHEYYGRVNKQPEASFAFNSPGSEIAGRQFLLDMAWHFPADLLARGYAALLRTLRYTDGIPVWGTAGSWWKDLFEDDHAALKHHLHRYGPVYAVAAMLLISGHSLPLAFGLLFFVLYVCGYVSLQCEFRHAFHLSFVPVWIAGFLLHCAWSGVRQLRHGIAASWGACRIPLRRMLVFAAASALLILAPLYGLRAYQQYRVTPLLSAINSAPRFPVPVKKQVEPGWVRFSLEEPPPPSPKELLLPGMNDLQALYALAGVFVLSLQEEDTTPIWHTRARYFALELAADPRVSWLTLLYESKIPWNNFSQLVRVHVPEEAGNSILYFFPAYALKMSVGDITARNRFSGFALPEEQAVAFKGLYEITDFSSLHFLMHAALPDGIVSAARKYQRILLAPDPLDAFRVDDEPVGVTVLAEMAARFSRKEEALLFYKAALLLNHEPVQRLYIAEGLLRLDDLDTACGVLLEYARQADADVKLTANLLGEAARRYAARTQPEKVKALLQSLTGGWAGPQPELLLQVLDVSGAQAQPELVLDCLAGILRTHPEHEIAANQADALMLKMEDARQAEAFWVGISEARPESVLPFLRLGGARDARGDETGGREAYAAAYRNGASNPEAALRHAVFVLLQSDPNGAFQRVQASVTDAPGLGPLAAVLLERAADRMARDQQHLPAAEVYAAASGYRPNDTTLRMRQAGALLDGGQPARAQEVLESLLDSDRAAEAADLLDQALTASGAPEDRLRAWQDILKRNPRNEAAARFYARALFLLGRYPETAQFVAGLDEETKTAPEIAMLQAAARLALREISPEDLAIHPVFKEQPELRAKTVALLQQSVPAPDSEDAQGWPKLAAQAVLLLAPESDEAWVNLGSMLEKEGNFEKALETYWQAFSKTGPGIRQLAADRIDAVYARQNLSRERLERWQEALKQYPGNTTVLLHTGLAYEANSLWREAADTYRAFASVESFATLARLRLGAVLVRLGDPAQGITEIRTAVEADAALRPLAAMLCLHAGTDLLQGGDPNTAGGLLELAAEFDPEDPFVHLHLGDARKAQDAHEAAETSWRRALQAGLDSAAGAEAARRLDAALPAGARLSLWKGLAEERPESLLPKARLALALADTGSPDEAALLCDAISAGNEDIEGRLACALVACLAGEFDRGFGELEAVLAQAPQLKSEITRQVADLGGRRLEEGNLEQAERLMRRAVELGPDNLLYSVHLGRALLAQQKFEEAAAQFKKVLLAVPESPNAAKLLDEAWAGLNNPELHRQDWQSITDARPDARIPREHLNALR